MCCICMNTLNTGTDFYCMCELWEFVQLAPVHNHTLSLPLSLSLSLSLSHTHTRTDDSCPLQSKAEVRAVRAQEGGDSRKREREI